MNQRDLDLLPSGYLLAREAAARYGVSGDYVARLCRENKVPGMLAGKAWLVEDESFRRFLRDSELLRQSRAQLLAAARKREYASRAPRALARRLRIGAATAIGLLVIAGGASAASGLFEKFEDALLAAAIAQKAQEAPATAVYNSYDNRVINNTTYNTYNTAYDIPVRESGTALGRNAISQEDFEQSVNRLRSELYAQLNVPATPLPSSGGVVNNIALSQIVDKLHNVALTNASVSGLSGLSDSDVPDDITVSGYLAVAGGTLTGAFNNSSGATSTWSGPLAVSALDVSTTTATSTFANGIRLSSGCFELPSGTCTGTGSGGTPGGSDAQVQFNEDGSFGGDTSFIFSTTTKTLTTLNFSATSATTTYATSTALSVFTAPRAPSFFATSTTASVFPYASSTALTVSGTGYFGTASTTALRLSGTQTFENLTSGGLAVNASGQVYKAATTTFSTGLTYANGAVTCDTANASTFGCLAAADWALFNDKVSSSSIDSSAELAALITDETGTGFAVFSASPAFTGAAVFADLTAAAATSTALFGGRITGNAAAFGQTATSSFSSAGALTLASALAVTSGGTGATTITGLVLGNGTSAMSAYAGTSCTNQFPRSLSASGAATCATVANADLANSTVSYGGIALSLGGSDTTPAFNLADATGLPIVAGTTGTLTVARGGTGVTSSTGSGSTVLSASPTLTGSVTVDGTISAEMENGDDAAMCHSGANSVSPGVEYTIGDCSLTPSADYMEMYPMAPDVEFGDVVAPNGEYATSTETGKLVPVLAKTSAAYQASAVGIASDPEKAGDFNSIGHEIADEDNPKPLALNGRVYVKVSAANGPIRVGDRLTSSAVPGAAMKATEPGRIIGTALEAFDPALGGTGRILTFVNPSFYVGDVAEDGSFGIAGVIAAEGFIDVSSKDAKKNIRRFTEEDGESVLERIGNLFVAEYHYEREDDSNPKRMGLIAEKAPRDILAEGGRGIDLYKFTSFLAAGIQALIAKMNALAEKITGNEEKIQELEERVAQLESKALVAGPTSATPDDKTQSSDDRVETSGVLLDIEPPVITINGNNPALLQAGDSYSDLGAAVSDNVDRNLGIKALVDGGEPVEVGEIRIDTSVPGEHTITYRATDQAGNTGEATRTVTVEPSNDGDTISIIEPLEESPSTDSESGGAAPADSSSSPQAASQEESPTESPAPEPASEPAPAPEQTPPPEI